MTVTLAGIGPRGARIAVDVGILSKYKVTRIKLIPKISARGYRWRLKKKVGSPIANETG